jgi:hypothetical protein
MPRNAVRWLVAFGMLLAARPGAAQLIDNIKNEITSGGPVVGVDVGAALPVSSMRKIADPGGSIAPFIGWQIGNGTGFTVTPIIQGQFAGFTESSSGDGTPSITSAHGGARFSLHDEAVEIYFGAVGGYYWSTSGPREHDNGNGFGISGGLNYDLWRGGALGIFARYDQAHIRPYDGADNQRTNFVTTGLEVRQVFLAAEDPPPPPTAAAAAPAAAAGEAQDRAARRELRLRQVQHPARRGADPRRGGEDAEGCG